MQEKKEYLRQYLLQQKKINRLNEMILLNPENKRKYTLQIKECNKCRQQIESRITAVDGDILSEILFLKYACGKNLLEISYIINYSLRQTERLHRKALEKFEI